MAEVLLRAAETHESFRQDEFQKALTYFRHYYTRELDVARALASELLGSRRLHEKALSRVQKDAERVIEVRRREDNLCHDGLMSSLREQLQTLQRNHQEEILLVRKASRDEDYSKGVAYYLLQSQYDRGLASAQDEVQSKASELESVQKVRAALRDLSTESLRTSSESILTEQNRYEQTLLSEQGRRQDLKQLAYEQFMTLTQERAHSGEDPSPGTRDQLKRDRHTNEEVLCQVEQARTRLEMEKLHSPLVIPGRGIPHRPPMVRNPVVEVYSPGAATGVVTQVERILPHLLEVDRMGVTMVDPSAAELTLRDLLEGPYMEDDQLTPRVPFRFTSGHEYGLNDIQVVRIFDDRLTSCGEFIQKTLSRKVAGINDNSHRKSTETVREYAWWIAVANRVMTIEISLDCLIERDVDIDRRTEDSYMIEDTSPGNSATIEPWTAPGLGDDTKNGMAS
ncbi:hypothetical protein DYB37_007162 [Aphanomyces astaci]|uniref:Uncharacterized protein n=1 Tax=Aphanomyces astaci TaxID=112090 RepID=A0A3R6ZFZ4_APHAT|nr:hypothetical protein DYB35_008538 [Aphanomyces astaci]RHZ06332.1 hypothetical protein DYB37_007162 [Aphanomyces astaci]